MTIQKTAAADSAGAPVKSAARALDLLDEIAAHGPGTQLQLSTRLNIPKSSLHALLRTMTARGWLQTDPTGSVYMLGIHSLVVSSAYLDGDPVLSRAAPVMDEVAAATGETVHLGRLDGAHDGPTCRACGRPVPPQDPVRLPRPTLGVLRLPDGERVPLDRGLVLGRRPEPRAGVGDWPRLLQLPGDSTYLSRVHLQIELDGWLVVARDLGSRAGTTWHVPGRAPVRMRPQEAYVLEPGHELDLADDYRIGYELS